MPFGTLFSLQFSSDPGLRLHSRACSGFKFRQDHCRIADFASNLGGSVYPYSPPTLVYLQHDNIKGPSTNTFCPPRNRFANFLLENLKEISGLKSGNTACEKQNGGRFIVNFVHFLKL